jgi:hypothetical protein
MSERGIIVTDPIYNTELREAADPCVFIASRYVRAA